MVIKMRVQATASPQSIHIVKVLCLIGIVVLLSIIVFTLIHTRKYVCVDANITEITKAINYGTENDSLSTKTTYIKFTYNVNGVEYRNQFRTFFVIGKSTGDNIKIWYNPQKPEVIRDRFLTEVCVEGILFLSVMYIGVFTIMNYK